MGKIASLLILATLVSCAQKELRKDLKRSALESNYQTAEIIHKGRHYFGLAALSFERGEKVSLSIAGIGRGTIKLRSDECSIKEERAYSDSREVDFTFDNLKPRCLISVFIFPQFSEDTANKIEWEGMKGTILLRESPKAILSMEQKKHGEFLSLDIPIEEQSRLYLKGCDVDYDETLYPQTFSLRFTYFRSCVIDGFIKTKTGKVTDVAAYFTTYDIRFSPLAIPEIERKGGSLSVKASEEVSLISYNFKVIFSNEGKFSNDSGTLRLYTVKGRYVFCEIGEEIKCYQ